MVRQWTPGQSEFDDIQESPKWRDPSFFVALCIWGAVVIGIGLTVATLLGRDVPASAWAVAPALITIATVLVARLRNP
jgi:hypothetical protein